MDSFLRPLAAREYDCCWRPCFHCSSICPASADQDRHSDVGPASGRPRYRRTPPSWPSKRSTPRAGLLGRKLEMVVADETENPEQGIAAIKKLTADDKVNVLIGGYTSGVTLAQLPHISNAKTIYLGVGAASPAITAKVKTDYENYKYIFRAFPINAAHQARALVDFINGKLKGEMGLKKIAIVGENAKWVQDLVPILKKGAHRRRHRRDAGRILRHLDLRLLAAVRQGEEFRRAVSDRDPVARLLGHLRQAVA